MISYLLHSTILLSGITLFYWIFLRNETFFRLNRWTFIFCILLSLLLPLITVPEHISMHKNEMGITNQVEQIIVTNTNLPADILTNTKLETEYTNAPNQPIETASSAISLYTVLKIIYFGGLLIFAAIFLLQLVILLTRKYNLNSVKTGKYSIVELVKDHEPYSFMNTIFINPTSYDPDTYEKIIEHEKLHIDQVHFFDKILAEIMVIMFWFNPLIWQLRSSISKNLEYLTDQSLINKGMDKKPYQMSLLKVSVSTKPFNLTNSYNNSFLKNRIQMMNSKKSSISSLWKYMFIPPLFLFSLISLNAVEGSTTNTAQIFNTNPSIEQTNDAVKVETPIKNKTIKQKPLYKKSDKKSSSENFNSNAPMAKKKLNLDDIHSIDVMNDVRVVLYQSNSQEISIEGPSDIIDEINTEVYKGEWEIHFDDRNKSYNYKNMKTSNVQISIGIPYIKSIHMSGVGSITQRGVFKQNNGMSVGISGTGDVETNVEAPQVNCGISGTGNIDITGTSDNVTFGLSGTGNINAANLSAKNATVGISGAGSVKVNASQTLTTAISGSGSIRYKGNPVVTNSSSGSGSVRPM